MKNSALLCVVIALMAYVAVGSEAAQRQVGEQSRKLDVGSETETQAKDSAADAEEVDPMPPLRTATGGPIHSILVLLCIVAFVGNGAFMIDVFWSKRKK
jgi:hypothetical protein